MRSIVTIAFVIVFAVITGCGQAQTISTHSVNTSKDVLTDAAKLEEVLPRLMEGTGVPGISIAVIRGGETAWTGNYGVMNSETGQPVTDATIFEAASLSKPVFAYGVLKLVDERIVDLDKPLYEYLGKDYVEDERIRKVTARMVLNHSPGFPNWRGRGKDLSFINDPGEKYSYSGEGFVYLQRVVEHLTEKPLNDYMNEAVFEPLGMSSSSFIWQDLYDKTCATGHDDESKPRRKRKPENANAAASLHTTAADYAKFLSALIHGTGLKKETHKAMFSKQISLPEKWRKSGVHPEMAWGLGIGLQINDEGTSFWHWGDNGPFKCYTVTFAEHGSGVVMFTNGVNGLEIAEWVVKYLTGGKNPAFDWLGKKAYKIE